MIQYHVADFYETPKLNKEDNSDYLKRLLPLSEKIGLVKEQAVNLIDAVFCEENNLFWWSQNSSRQELAKMPKYQDYLLINAHGFRNTYARLDVRQKEILLNIIKGQDPRKRQYYLPPDIKEKMRNEKKAKPEESEKQEKGLGIKPKRR